jgi:hypothetical protein
MLYWTYGVILNPGKLSAKYLAEQAYSSSNVLLRDIRFNIFQNPFPFHQQSV